VQGTSGCEKTFSTLIYHVGEKGGGPRKVESVHANGWIIFPGLPPRNLCAVGKLFMAALLMIARIWKQPDVHQQNRLIKYGICVEWNTMQ
jgi:hypothetical protein